MVETSQSTQFEARHRHKLLEVAHRKQWSARGVAVPNFQNCDVVLRAPNVGRVPLILGGVFGLRVGPPIF